MEVTVETSDQAQPQASLTGTFSCVEYLNADMDAHFQRMVKDVAILATFQIQIKIPELNVEITDENKQRIRKNDSTDAEEDDDIEWVYYLPSSPRVGEEYQADMSVVGREFEGFDEKVYLGELVWDPTKLEATEIDSLFEKTKIREELDREEVSPSEETVKTEITGPTTKICTKEDIYHLLHANQYDVNLTAKQMLENEQYWSQNKKNIKKWDRNAVLEFGAGMTNHNRLFRDMLKYELGASKKTVPELIEFYYMWKKFPSCAHWKLREELDEPEKPLETQTTFPNPNTNIPLQMDQSHLTITNKPHPFFFSPYNLDPHFVGPSIQNPTFQTELLEPSLVPQFVTSPVELESDQSLKRKRSEFEEITMSPSKRQQLEEQTQGKPEQEAKIEKDILNRDSLPKTEIPLVKMDIFEPPTGNHQTPPAHEDESQFQIPPQLSTNMLANMRPGLVLPIPIHPVSSFNHDRTSSPIPRFPSDTEGTLELPSVNPNSIPLINQPIVSSPASVTRSPAPSNTTSN